MALLESSAARQQRLERVGLWANYLRRRKVLQREGKVSRVITNTLIKEFSPNNPAYMRMIAEAGKPVAPLPQLAETAAEVGGEVKFDARVDDAAVEEFREDADITKLDVREALIFAFNTYNDPEIQKSDAPSLAAWNLRLDFAEIPGLRSRMWSDGFLKLMPSGQALEVRVSSAPTLELLERMKDLKTKAEEVA